MQTTNGKKKQVVTFVDILLSEALNGTFNRNLLHTSALAELEFPSGKVFGQDVPELQGV